MPSGNPYMIGGGSGGLQIKQKFSGMLENFATTAQNIVFTFPSSVTPSNCIILLYQRESSYNAILTIRDAYVLTSSSLTVRMQRGSAGVSSKVVFEVIELVEGSFKSLQKGHQIQTISSGFTGETPVNISISAVDLNKSLIISSGDLQETSPDSRFTVTPRFSASDQLRYTYYISSASTGNFISFTWNVVEFN